MSRPCHAFDESCSVLSQPQGSLPVGSCRFCGWFECAMGCGTMVEDERERCAECHPLACPCEDCVAFESLPDAHTKDEHCAGHVNADGDCAVCGVTGGEMCSRCNGVRFHRDTCADSDGVPEVVSEEDTSAQTVETRTLSDAELLALLDTMVDCQGDIT